jgi:hypothetical protein
VTTQAALFFETSQQNKKVQVVKSGDFDEKTAKSPIIDEFFRDSNRFFASYAKFALH